MGYDDAPGRIADNGGLWPRPTEANEVVARKGRGQWATTESVADRGPRGLERDRKKIAAMASGPTARPQADRNQPLTMSRIFNICLSILSVWRMPHHATIKRERNER